MIEMLAFLAAFLATLLAIPPLLRVAPAWGLVDVATGRKVHEGAIPLIGGLVMGVVFLCMYLALALGGLLAASAGLAAGIAIVLVGGLIDDLHELRSSIKFAFQIAAAVALIRFGQDTMLTQLGQLLSPQVFTLGAWSVPLTVFAIVGVMNAANMVDGIDGLAGTLCLFGFIVFGVLAAWTGETTVFVVTCLAAGVTAGFLCFNLRTPSRPRAVVFMGDTGSHFLGLLLAWCAIRLHNAEPPALNAVSAGWVLGIMLGDTLSVMVRRVLRGRSPFKGDREHLHHLLLDAGLSTTQTVLAMAGLSLAAGAIALAAEKYAVPGYAMFYLYLALLTAYCVFSERVFRRRRLREPSAGQ
jgi:UDP-GlcNAc:undecaprenyl-phosphate GlcNAc-1-phosphate transferase